MSEAATRTVAEWLKGRLTSSRWEAVAGEAAKLLTAGPVRFVQSFSAIARLVPEAPLRLSAEEEREAGRRLGWSPKGWSLADGARAWLALVPAPGGERDRCFRLLAETAELNEAIAFVRALPLLPEPAALRPFAEEAARSNVRTIFEAIALDNPFPARHFDEIQWNQLVMKAIFLDSPLAALEGLEERRNGRLTQMARDCLSERRSAGRTIPPDLFRLVEGVSC